MCGGFPGLYSQREGMSTTRHLSYHLGRLITYLTLGTLAGSLGSSLNQISALIGVQRAATLVVGTILIIWGLKNLGMIELSVRNSSASFKFLTAPFANLLARTHIRSAAWFPLALGIVTTLLPCGWLYAYVAVAAATGSARDGLIVMTVFWLGTVPALAGLGVGISSVFPQLTRYAPKVTAVLLLLAGVFSLFGHALAPLMESASCHLH